MAVSKSVKVRVPSGMDRTEFEQLLEAALAAGVAPAVVPRADTEPLQVRLGGALLAGVREVMRQHGLPSEGKTASALVYAIHAARQAERAAAARAQEPAADGDVSWARDEHQAAFYLRLRQGLMEGKIVLAEGSTGIGKGRAMLRAVLDAMDAGRIRRAVIAGPTIAALAAVAREWAHVPHGGRTLRVLPGAQNLVCPQKIEDLWSAMEGEREVTDEEREQWRRALEWARSGGAPVLPATRELAEGPDAPMAGAAYLVDDFRRIAPALDPDEVVLDEHDLSELSAVTRQARKALQEAGLDDALSDLDAGHLDRCPDALRSSNPALASALDGLSPALRVLARLRGAARGADIRLCTHAMLTLERLRGDSDGHDCVVVDEAHLLEQNAALVLTSAVSLFLLRAHARKAGLNDVAAAVEQAHERLREIASRHGMNDRGVILGGGERDLFRTDAEREMLAGIKSEAKRLLEVMARAGVAGNGNGAKGRRRRRKAALDGRVVKELEKAAQAMRRIVQKDVIVYNVSPIRKYVSIGTGPGPAEVQGMLGRMWQEAGAGALVSATIYVPVSRVQDGTILVHGKPHSSAYLERVAGLGKLGSARLSRRHPVEADWVWDARVRYATPEAHAGLIPPRHPDLSGKSREEAEALQQAYRRELARWSEALARQIAAIAGQPGADGVMALFASYEALEAVAGALMREGGPLVNPERLIVQRRGVRAHALADRFREMRLAGGAPVWLAAGSAWYAIDVTHQGRSLVTDLVITRMPIGLNQTTTYLWRSRRGGGGTVRHDAPATEAYWMFRQGLGRLIRSARDRGKRIWVLDPRIWAEEWSRYGRPIRHLLGRYADAGPMPPPGRERPDGAGGAGERSRAESTVETEA